MKSSYSPNDVTLLLKDITGKVTPKPAKEREKLIQSGIHYCEMLPLEYQPSPEYMEAYYLSLETYKQVTADAVCQVCEKLYQKKGTSIVLVSLARAGIPIGILMKHYLEQKYHFTVPHYSVSIIRGRGIDANALNYIMARHEAEDIQFVDGWIGKGAIQKELKSALAEYPQICTELAVLSDPANITDLCGTHKDILIPSSCLNSTVSGLISRTFLRDDIIFASDFHGAAYYKELAAKDVSNQFINTIEECFDFSTKPVFKEMGSNTGIQEVSEIAAYYNINDINFIKPGIGEATRVLLRRVPWKLLIQEHAENDSLLLHIIQLAKEKNVPVEYYPLKNYKACGIIKKCADV